MEATLAKPATPAPSKEEAVPDWKLWKKAFLDGYPYFLMYAGSKEGTPEKGYETQYNATSDKGVRKGQVTQSGSLCQCCGGLWINQRGGWIADRGAQITAHFFDAVTGIYFGEFQGTETFKKNTNLKDEDHFFEIQDGKDTHTFGWRDA